MESTTAVVELIKVFGVLIGLGWYMYHTTTVTIPRLIEEFRKDAERQEQSNRDNLTEERRLFTDTLQKIDQKNADQVLRYDRKHDQLLDIIRQIAEAIRSTQFRIPSGDSDVLKKEDLAKRK